MRISTATTLINQGAVIDPETGRTQRLHRIPVQPETFLRELADVIEESRTDGYADRLLGSMQHVTVIDYRTWAGREDELGKRDRGHKPARVGPRTQDIRVARLVPPDT
jgi:hypothetical protein